jgi:hypothetical protein
MQIFDADGVRPPLSVAVLKHNADAHHFDQRREVQVVAHPTNQVGGGGGDLRGGGGQPLSRLLCACHAWMDTVQYITAIGADWRRAHEGVA